MASESKSLAKTNPKYWSKRVFRHARDGKESAGLSVRIQHDGQRHCLALKSANRERAGIESRDLYLQVKANGWNDFFKNYDTPSGNKKLVPVNDGLPKQRGFIERPTVGDLIQTAGELLNVRRSTFESYAKSLRTIASQIYGLQPRRKYAQGEEAQKWRDRVDRIPLDKITPSQVMAWKNSRLREQENDPVKKRATIVTVNTAMRGAKALSGKKILLFLRERMNLPNPMPFDGVPPERMPALRYRSRIDAAKLLKAAQSELAPRKPEQYKIFLLAMICGLRKGEIDCLLWEAFDFEKSILRIEHTRSHELKTDDSAGEIDLDEETAKVFAEFHAISQGKFVIEWGSEKTNRERKTRSYRCDWLFNRLYEWLKSHGVQSNHPLHELRKEVGSIIANEQGIFEASRYLRHSDVRITSQFYTDKKKKITPGLGAFLGDAIN